MSLAEERIMEIVNAMSDEEKKTAVKYIESEYMRDELQRRYDNCQSVMVNLGGNRA